jgi:Zn finger protein HypA/HybF involved in hydrogenase expression
MKLCKKCGNEFKPIKGLINYCSLECRNSRDWTEEDKKKKSVSAKNSEKLKKQLNSIRTEEVYDKIVKTKKEKHIKQILKSNYEDLSFESLRFRILYEQENKCNNCGLDKWLDKDIILELDHKDGNNKNNVRDNLEMICPNCHSLTQTWRGRNKKERRHRVPDKQLLESLLVNEWNMRQSLLNVGLSPKGGNYKRCHKLKKEYLSLE